MATSSSISAGEAGRMVMSSSPMTTGIRRCRSVVTLPLMSRVFDLARFRRAQDGTPGFNEALGELRAGAKIGHWIWYVFPQLRGLGRSSMAVRFGLDGVAEAA